jgi:hypothetical protein
MVITSSGVIRSRFRKLSVIDGPELDDSLFKLLVVEFQLRAGVMAWPAHPSIVRLPCDRSMPGTFLAGA